MRTPRRSGHYFFYLTIFCAVFLLVTPALAARRTIRPTTPVVNSVPVVVTPAPTLGFGAGDDSAAYSPTQFAPAGNWILGWEMLAAICLTLGALFGSGLGEKLGNKTRSKPRHSERVI